MKSIYTLTLTSLLLLGGASCSKDFLDEKPLDFLSTNTAYKTVSDFNAATNNLYNLVRFEFYGNGENEPMDYLYGTDIVYDGQASQARFSNYPGTMDPSAYKAFYHWQAMYKMVAEANTIISRLAATSIDDATKQTLEGRARFFRAFAYRNLVYLYGGVPLVTEEVTSATTDYTRAPKADVLKQIIADLTFAADNLPDITKVRDGEISQVAAQHLLAEVNLAAGDYPAAVAAATAVISNPAMALMNKRFGSSATVTPGDVYYDLFRVGNQNRSGGNTEGIWVVQFETDVLGGAANTQQQSGNPLYERHFAPFVRDLTVGGTTPFRWPVGDFTGGRGIGWGISTKYFSNTIWESDFTNDIRNANHNFVRTLTYNDPGKPAFFGKTISTEAPPAGVTVPSRQLFAYQSKVTTPFNHPTNLYANPATFLLKATAGGTYTDQYMFRLAETYLLRAEANLGAGNAAAAAADLNVVRARAKATPVAPGAVTIDYILDERMRELGVEEKRRLTLMRLGLLFKQVKAHNPYYSDIQERHNLFPIPFNEIERNRDAVLEQNPGY